MGRAEHTFGRNDTHCTPPDVFEPVLEALRLTEFGLDPFGNPFSVVPTKSMIMLEAAEVKNAHGHIDAIDYAELVRWRQDGNLVPSWSDDPLQPLTATVTWGDAYDYNWSGLGAVFCNGPTSLCKPWAEKVHGEEGGDENISLWPVRTGAKWWQKFVAPSDCICFWEGRVTFLGSRDQAPWHNALSYVGPRGDLFYEGMKKYGWCVRNKRDWS
jgi:hypothetical protein